jgi:hypothetical protein
MAGILDFVARFGSEEQCIAYLAELRWPAHIPGTQYITRLAERRRVVVNYVLWSAPLA